MSTNLRVTVLGANGRVGALVCDRALAAGHTVVAAARDPRTVAPRPAAGDRLCAKPIDVDDARCMAEVVDGADAVVVALGPRYRNGNPLRGIEGRDDVAPAAMRTLLAVAPPNAHVVLLSAVGAGDSWGGLPWVARAFLQHTGLRTAFGRLGEAEELLRADGRPFTVVRAVRLVDAAASAATPGEAPPDATGKTLRGNPSLTRERLAQWLVELAVERRHAGRVLVAAG